MRTLYRVVWIAVPAMMSLAGSCSDQITPVAPAPITTVTITLSSPPVAAPADPSVQAAYQSCLAQTPQPSIRPSWRDYASVAFASSGADTWQARFTDVPVGFVNTFFVLDPHECARTPTGDGRTVRGVSANDVALASAQTPVCRTETCDACYFVFTVTTGGSVTMASSGR
jgi:hypothetical protein